MCLSIPGHTGFILSIIKKNQSTAIILKCAGVRHRIVETIPLNTAKWRHQSIHLLIMRGLNLIILAGVTGKTG